VANRVPLSSTHMMGLWLGPGVGRLEACPDPPKLPKALEPRPPGDILSPADYWLSLCGVPEAVLCRAGICDHLRMVQVVGERSVVL
jgi:hypothetical protein